LKTRDADPSKQVISRLPALADVFHAERRASSGDNTDTCGAPNIRGVDASATRGSRNNADTSRRKRKDSRDTSTHNKNTLGTCKLQVR
jgi:hypothetical protein